MDSLKTDVRIKVGEHTKHNKPRTGKLGKLVQDRANRVLGTARLKPPKHPARLEGEVGKQTGKHDEAGEAGKQPEGRQRMGPVTKGDRR